MITNALSTSPSKYLLSAIEVHDENSDQDASEINSAIYQQETCQNQFTTKKIAAMAICLTLFTGSSFTAYQWAINTKILDPSMCINGIAIATICKLALPSDALNFLNTRSTDWAGETFFFSSQIHRALPKKYQTTLGSSFIWVYGAMQAKDFLNHITLKQADLPLSAEPLKEEDLLKMISYTTHDTRKRSIVMGIILVAGIGLTIFDFVWLKSKYMNYDDFGKLGVYQDLFAMLTFYPMSQLVTGYLCDKARALETDRFDKIFTREEGGDGPHIAQYLNLAKRISFMASPIFISITLALAPLSTPNTVQDYFRVGAATFVCEHVTYLSKEVFENSKSRLHEINEIDNEENPQLFATKCSVVSWMKKYGSSILFELGFIGFFVAVLVENQKDWSLVGGMLLISIITFVATDLLGFHYRPKKNNRALNSLTFHVLYSSFWMTFFYEYVTTKLEMDHQNLKRDSKELYLMQHLGWYTLAALLAKNRATCIQKRNYSLLTINPAYYTQEMIKFFIDRLRA